MSTPNTYRYVAEKKGAGYRTWAIYRDTVYQGDGSTVARMFVARNLDPLQANAAAALLNGNHDWEFDMTSDGVVRLVLFRPETP